MARARLALLIGVPVLILLVLVLLKPLGFLPTTMSVGEYEAYKKGGSQRAFKVTGTVAGSETTGTRTVQAGAFDVTFSGGFQMRTPDGRDMHALDVKGDDGTEGRFYFDPNQLTAPAPGRSVELHGRFESIPVMQQFGPPTKWTVGVVSEIVAVD